MEKTKQIWRAREKQISDVKQKEYPSIDRLSALPDDVLVHILSFLPTQLSVSTSVLGKRWRCVWAHVPNLDLNSDDEIINKVMLLHKRQNINNFCLSHFDDCSDFQFEAWIATLIDRSVRKLDICLDCQVKLPRCLFNCKTLVDLSLAWCGDIPMTGTVFLPALKKLQLDRVTYESAESLQRLISGCPVLEDLFVEREKTNEDTLVCCCISSTTLNKLKLISGRRVIYGLKLDAPALRSLTLYEFVSQDFSAGDLTSLIEANINLQAHDLINDYALYSRSVIEFVGKMNNLKCLKLTTFRMEVPDSAFSALTMKFYNLTELKLNADCRFIQKLLENADNLEVLNIRIVYGDLNWTEPKQVPACLTSHLGTVRIHDLQCDEKELSMVRYILRNAKVLKRMEIQPFIGGNDLETLKRVSLFERGSEACQLAFH
ncbi:putative fbd-associated F-box protein at5g56440 [Phtheirospermum japonicum]|uniref:Putative fbd-associated F-box protein at5g56440 n=1 Tax=Phtheirospermum japonicum TaxID=374723 RepID=A0A830C4K4_9LAMI|nr:putative fbd-associated F-box protein at5g56440 [Phtheirospermum japonicum]